MAKPITAPTTDDEGYTVDLISDDPNLPPTMVQTNMRHLLLACELGDLVVMLCTRVADNSSAYILCASVVSANNKRRLLPICEIPDTNALLAGMRPPAAAEDAFVKPTHTGHYSVCLLGNPEEVALAEVTVESVH